MELLRGEPPLVCSREGEHVPEETPAHLEAELRRHTFYVTAEDAAPASAVERRVEGLRFTLAKRLRRFPRRPPRCSSRPLPGAPGPLASLLDRLTRPTKGGPLRSAHPGLPAGRPRGPRRRSFPAGAPFRAVGAFLLGRAPAVAPPGRAPPTPRRPPAVAEAGAGAGAGAEAARGAAAPPPPGRRPPARGRGRAGSASGGGAGPVPGRPPRGRGAGPHHLPPPPPPPFPRPHHPPRAPPPPGGLCGRRRQGFKRGGRHKFIDFTVAVETRGRPGGRGAWCMRVRVRLGRPVAPRGARRHSFRMAPSSVRMEILLLAAPPAGPGRISRTCGGAPRTPEDIPTSARHTCPPKHSFRPCCCGV